VAVAGFGGMRDDEEVLAFAPCLVAPLERLAFRLLHRGRRLRVEVRPEDARYELLDGDPLELRHHGERLLLEVGRPVVRPYPSCLEVPPVGPPPGREPMRRNGGG
jgi:alpha,alpha-trehalose phosphorylase